MNCSGRLLILLYYFIDLCTGETSDVILDFHTNCAVLCLKKCVSEDQSCEPCLFWYESQSNSESDECFGGNVTTNSPMETSMILSSKSKSISSHFVSVNAIEFAWEKEKNTAYFLIQIKQGKDQSWRLAKITNNTLVEYHSSEKCDEWRYIRLISIDFGGSVTFYSPSNITSSPPDFAISESSLRLDSAIFDSDSHKATVKYSWKHPFGYSLSDISEYEAYIHMVSCVHSSEFGHYRTPKAILTYSTTGVLMNVDFNETMVRNRCKFFIQLDAKTKCGRSLAQPVRKVIKLDCQTIAGITCSNRTAPICSLDVVVKSSHSNSIKGGIDVTLNWPEPKAGPPLYYHLRHGLAETVNLFNSGLRRFKRFDPMHRDIAQKSRPGFGRDARPPPGFGPDSPPGFGLEPSGFGSPMDILYRLNNGIDIKVEGHFNEVILVGEPVREVIGVQICAIYSSAEKQPKFQLMKVVPVECACCAPGKQPCASTKCGSPKSLEEIACPPQSLKINLPLKLKSTQNSTIYQISWDEPANVKAGETVSYDFVTSAKSEECPQEECCRLAKTIVINLETQAKNMAEIILPNVQKTCHYDIKLAMVTSLNRRLSQLISIDWMGNAIERMVVHSSTGNPIVQTIFDQSQSTILQHVGNEVYISTTNDATENTTPEMPDSAIFTTERPKYTIPVVRTKQGSQSSKTNTVDAESVRILYITVPLAGLIILCALLALLCYFKWRQIQDCWVKRRKASFHPSKQSSRVSNQRHSSGQLQQLQKSQTPLNYYQKAPTKLENDETNPRDRSSQDFKLEIVAH